MRLSSRSGLAALVLVAALVAGGGWFFAADGTDGLQLGGRGSERFDDCRWQGDQLVLDYTYGANTKVAVDVDTRADGVVVSLTTVRGGGATPMLALFGETRSNIFGGRAPVRYRDGLELRCP